MSPEQLFQTYYSGALIPVVIAVEVAILEILTLNRV